MRDARGLAGKLGVGDAAKELNGGVANLRGNAPQKVGKVDRPRAGGVNLSNDLSRLHVRL